jgi:hypothetical protein
LLKQVASSWIPPLSEMRNEARLISLSISG